MTKKPFLGAKSLSKGRECQATKMNITFYMGNKVLNIFSSNNFFEKSNILGENREKKLLGDMTIFWEGSSYAKNEYDLVYQKLDSKYFHVI